MLFLYLAQIRKAIYRQSSVKLPGEAYLLFAVIAGGLIRRGILVEGAYY